MSKSPRYAAKGLLAATVLAGWAAYAPAKATPFSFNYTFGGSTNQTYTPSGPGTLLSSATTVTQGREEDHSNDDGSSRGQIAASHASASGASSTLASVVAEAAPAPFKPLYADFPRIHQLNTGTADWSVKRSSPTNTVERDCECGRR